MNCWLVIFKGQVMDQVYYTKDCSKDYVRSSLVNHDGYPSSIVIVKA
jgi:hypothetical protein